MSKCKKKIKYSKERIVMADILPYEVPITYSNRHFYNFLVDNKIEFSNGYLYWEKKDLEFDKLIEFIFNINIITENILEENGINKYSIKSKLPYQLTCLETIPFTFKISHKQNDFRELSIIHPINQLVLIDFYNKYKELIIYYCNKSPYSIRKPYKVAKFTYFNDAKHKDGKEENPERDLIEVFGKEYENIKTYFVYKKYSNIHKFYESYTYQRNEKKFNKLFKFDITKCFDSIYTHSLSWALSNKEIVKENININAYTFGGVFDSLMQKLNYNETNGIIIGPEFSRIFAEILLQQIDFSVYCYLECENIKHKTDYAIFRYVDDYFLFYNEESKKETIIEKFKVELKKYKLYINESKSISYQKPIITELTIAKERINNLLNKLIELNAKEINNSDEEDNEEEKNKPQKYSLFFNSKYSIVDFKQIIKETGIEYKDILNYTLAIIDRKIFNLIKKYDNAVFENKEKEDKFKDVFIKTLFELIDFIMFLYSVSPQVNTTIKLCLILTKITKFIKQKTDKEKRNKYFNQDQKDFVFKKIFDDISLVLTKNKNSEYRQIESLYLLIVLQDLGKEYRLDKNALRKFLNIKLENGKYEFPYHFNYWSIIVLLFYIRDIKRYSDIRFALIEHIIHKFKSFDKNNIRKYTEIVILSLDLLSCPFLLKNVPKDMEDEFRLKVISEIGESNELEIKNKVAQRIKEKIYENKIDIFNNCMFRSMNCNEKIEVIQEIENTENWFTKWNNFDFEKELNTKRSIDVY
jgi:hypothetical protein